MLCLWWQMLFFRLITIALGQGSGQNFFNLLVYYNRWCRGSFWGRKYLVYINLRLWRTFKFSFQGLNWNQVIFSAKIFWRTVCIITNLNLMWLGEKYKYQLNIVFRSSETIKFLKIKNKETNFKSSHFIILMNIVSPYIIKGKVTN